MEKINTIFTHNEGKGELGIDDKGNLYWNKKLVITESKISLNWWQSAFAILASISTAIIAIYTMLAYYCK